MSGWIGDVRFGLRQLAKNPGISALAVLALGLGIGANTAIFSVVKTVLLESLPARDPDRLVRFYYQHRERKGRGGSTSYADVCEWRRQMRSFEAIAAFQPGTGVLTGGDQPERVTLAKVNAGFFPMLGVRPVLGRNFSEEEDRPGAGRVALISHELFARRFGGEWKGEGATIMLNEQPHVVIGVLPPRFRFLDPRPDLWVPLAMAEARGPKLPSVSAFGRLSRGITREQAQVDLDRASEAAAAREPAYKVLRLQTEPISNWISPDVKTSLWVLLGAVALVLLIACANVANLLLSRAAARRREIAVRAAIGAGRLRLARQMLAESIPLAVMGAGLGLLLAIWGIELLPRIDVSRIPRVAEARVDGVVLAFTAAVSLFTGLLFGLAPAIALSRTDLHDALKEGGRAGVAGTRGARLRAALVVVEVALALVLSIGATLMMRTVYHLSNVHPGFNPDKMLAASLELPRGKFKSREEAVAHTSLLMERVRALPGVKAAALTNSLPLGGNYMRANFAVEGRQYRNDSEWPMVGTRTVDAAYFRALEIPLLRGRYFDATDRVGSPPVVVINETAARRLFGSEDPVGKHLNWPEVSFTVVGVAADIKQEDVSWEAGNEVLLCSAQYPSLNMTMAIRVDPRVYADPVQLAPALRRAVATVDKNLPVFRLGAMEKIMSDRLGPRRMNMILLSLFAGLALLLAALGIYSVVSFSVTRRSHEIGVRMAMGAQGRDVTRMVVRQGVMLAVAGLAIGGAAAVALGQLVRSVLFGVTPTDPLVFAAAAVVLAGVAALASWLPARRAASLDPLVALRCE